MSKIKQQSRQALKYKTVRQKPRKVEHASVSFGVQKQRKSERISTSFGVGKTITKTTQPYYMAREDEYEYEECESVAQHQLSEQCSGVE